jgi:hypothetical protein
MINGTASVEALARGAATIPEWSHEPLRFDDVICFQLVAELRRAGRSDLLPPGLHPTDPPTLCIQAWSVASSPWGAFTWAFARLSCRSGVRARGLTLAAVATTDDATDALRSHLGFPCRTGSVTLNRHYDGAELEVDDTLRIRSVDARPLGVDDVQYTGTMNLAHTPNGLRLVQVEAEHEPLQVDRMRGRIEHFDADAWGDPRLDPYGVIAATVAHERAITVPALRFACRPDVSAFEGTERIA